MKVPACNHNWQITKNNIIESSIYFTVRKVISADWLNDRDYFLQPNNKWEKDTEFQNDSLTYTLFSNNIQSKFGTNHWIPFTETEVGAHYKFESNFMTDFIAGKIKQEQNKIEQTSIFTETPKQRKTALTFSPEATAVFNAGRELWKMYHSQPKCNVNASFYDIREHFQGRNDKGKMNNKSADEKYNLLLGNLREKLKVLAKKIEPKVYEYGFLKT